MQKVVKTLSCQSHNASSTMFACSRRFYCETSYLQKVFTTHEVSLEMNQNNVSLFESNHLPANHPTEDRKFVGRITVPSEKSRSGEKEREVLCMGVVDGHAGYKCAQAVSNRLLNYIATSIHAQHSPTVDQESTVTRYLLPGDYSESLSQQENTARSLRDWAQERSLDIPSSSMLSDSVFTDAFEKLDHSIISSAIGSISQQLTAEDVDEIETGLSGSCALVVALDGEEIVCANSGDCRAVLGQLRDDGQTWNAVPLTREHNADCEEERTRVLSGHPSSEHTTILQRGRLFGSLLPLRAFGDMLYKLNGEQLSKLQTVFDVRNFQSKSLSPPYLSVSPEVTRKKFEPGKDKFVIIATDGLWDFLDSNTAVEVIGQHIKDRQSNRQLDDSDEKHRVVSELCLSNGATRLICHAVGQASCSSSFSTFIQLDQMIRLAPGETRENRDDIQVFVLYFD